MDPSSMKLPPHLEAEARLLRDSSATDNPVTELQSRPLIKSTVLWLLRHGCVNRDDSPNVIRTAGELLHAIIPLHACQVPKGKTTAVPFDKRIFQYFQNHITRSDSEFQIQVSPDEELTTPMRALERAGMVKICDSGEGPLQGHSGKSIIGKPRERIMHAAHQALVAPLTLPTLPPPSQMSQVWHRHPQRLSQSLGHPRHSTGPTKPRDGHLAIPRRNHRQP